MRAISGPRDRLEVGDDRQRLGLRLGERRRARRGQQAAGRVLGHGVGGERVAPRDLAQHHAARALGERALERVQRAIDLRLARVAGLAPARRSTPAAATGTAAPQPCAREQSSAPPPRSVRTGPSASRSPRLACASRAGRTASPPASDGPRRRTPRRSRSGRGARAAREAPRAGARGRPSAGCGWCPAPAGRAAGRRAPRPAGRARRPGSPPRARRVAARAGAAPPGRGSGGRRRTGRRGGPPPRGSGGTRASGPAARRRPPPVRARSAPRPRSAAAGAI